MSALSVRLRDTQYSSQNCEALLQSLASGETTTWAEAAQVYNALAGLREQSPDATRMKAQLQQLFDALTDDEGHRARFERDEVNELLQAMQISSQP